MRKIIPLFAFVLFCTYGHSQIRKLKASQVPEILPESFRVKFGKIRPTDWVYDSSCICYKAHFIKKTNECAAYFTAEGTWLRTETEIDKGTIPAVIVDAFNQSEFKDWEITATYSIATPDIASGCQYNVKKDKQAVYLVYDLKGKLLRKNKL